MWQTFIGSQGFNWEGLAVHLALLARGLRLHTTLVRSEIMLPGWGHG